ncbi:PaaI family thioesterase [Oceanobacter mangrovi]|uniref:PaaI family thioesterase n=1 Tax=Oceanobacter mangrovi TaxID=2862510 RepID=UPI001C8DAE5A|nr:PaaI family thioesterase [Oceanobacter mangrovi]
MSNINIAEQLRLVKQHRDYQQLADAIPYARTIGIKVQSIGDELLFVLPRNPDNIGNPMLPAIHGGVIGGFMELAAALQLLIKTEPASMPKVVDFSLDYLRAGRDRETYAECQLWRQGSRIANVAITAWQTERSNPIATARAHFLVKPAE